MVSSRLSQCSGNSVNLEKIIQNYAWKKYTSSLGKAKSFLLKKDSYAFDLQWDFLDFSHDTHVTIVKPEDELLNSVDFGTPDRPKGMRRSKRWKKLQSPQCFYKKVAMDFDDPVVMDTVYVKNTTDSDQTHAFSCMAVASPVSVEFTHNYSLGDNTNIELTLPTSSSEKSFTVTDCVGQDFHDVSTLNFNEKVMVEAGHRIEAIFLAREKTDTCEFEVTTILSLAIGCLPVVIRRKADDKIMFTCFITSLDDVFDQHVGASLSLIESVNGICNVMVKSRGKCKLTKWVDPQIIIQSEPILPSA